MRVTDLLRAESIQLHASPADKAAAVDLLVALHSKAGNLTDQTLYKKHVSPPGRTGRHGHRLRDRRSPRQERRSQAARSRRHHRSRRCGL